jgi:hypothetical protein
VAETEKPTVASLGRTQQIMMNRLTGPLHLLQGTQVMRDSGELFLPRYDQETDRVYENRRSRAVLYNYYRRTAQALAGRPFREPVKVENQSQSLDRLLTNIDSLGQNIHSFLHETFMTGVAKGYVALLAEFPQAAPADNLQEEREMGLRPYLRAISPEDFIAGFAEIIQGEEVVTHVRFREDELVQAGWGELLRERIRLYELRFDAESGAPVVVWELWELQEKRKRGTPEKWEMIDDGILVGMTRIPLTVFYAGERESFLLCDPPLAGLADLNIAHFQSESDQRHVLTVARFPILAGTGIDEDDNIEVGPNKFLKSSAEGSRFYYVEHSGAAIGAGRQDLKDLEERMATMGVDLMVRRAGDRATATARNIDESRGGSVLQAMSEDFSWVATQALRFMELWMGQADPTVTVALDSDFGLALKDQTEINALIQMRAGGDLSRKNLIREYKRRNLLPEVFDEELNDEELEDEGPDLSLVPPLPGRPPEPEDDDEDDQEDDEA